MLVDWRDSAKLPRDGYFPERREAVSGAIVHNTGGYEDITLDNDYHRISADWDPQEAGVQHAPHVAYHLWIPREGTAWLRGNGIAGVGPVVVWCNYLWEAAWHARGANQSCVGIALQGDGEAKDASDDQKAALRWVLDELLPRESVPVARERVWGHGETPSVWGGGPDWGNVTVCPGRMILPLIWALRGGE